MRYHDAKQVPTLAPFTMSEMLRRAYSLAVSFTDHDVRTYFLNAIPYLFTFLAHPGLSPYSNDVEREIRGAVILQRNMRHKLISAEGRDVFSIIMTFICTCHEQRISPGRALLETMLDPDWNLFERTKDTPYSVINPDGTRYLIFAGNDPPTLGMRRVVRQEQTDSDT